MRRLAMPALEWALFLVCSAAHLDWLGPHGMIAAISVCGFFVGRGYARARATRTAR